MTSDATPAPPKVRFPTLLTIVVAVALAIILSLGWWQLQRAAWKTRELARIDQLGVTPARPLAAVLAGAALGQDVSLARVTATCAPAPPPTPLFRMATENGEWIARALAPCRLTGAPYDGIMVDRGYLTASRGSTAMPTVVLPAPVQVEGVLLPRTKLPPAGLERPAPYVLVAEKETPPAPGVVPATVGANAADNMQYVGAYALTWFGLAGVLAAIYAAMLWRRYHPRASS